VDVDDDRLLEHVREWHQAAGQADLLTIEDNKDVTVQFKTRAAAEQVRLYLNLFGRVLTNNPSL
jgi:hypothetical protein